LLVMGLHSFPIAFGSLAFHPYGCAEEDAAGWIVAEFPAQYRPRHPERSAFYQLFETHFDSYVRAYEERFEVRSGPLRPAVVHSVEEFLSCGRLQGGFARIRCPKCHAEHLLAFSCRTRNFCSSCQAKRSVLFAEKLVGKILAPVPHRHWTFSIPRVLRGLFERERGLLSLLSQTAYASILKSFQALLERKVVRPGCVFSLQTFGAYGANFNPHCHGLVTDGVFSADGQFLSLSSLDASAVTEVFRRMLLLRLHKAERLSESFMQNLLSWVRSNGSTASRLISRTRGNIVKDSMEPTPTAGGFLCRPRMERPPAWRPRCIRSGTIRIVPGKRAAHGLG
jgi:hypothetical protein